MIATCHPGKREKISRHQRRQKNAEQGINDVVGEEMSFSSPGSEKKVSHAEKEKDHQKTVRVPKEEGSLMQWIKHD